MSTTTQGNPMAHGNKLGRVVRAVGGTLCAALLVIHDRPADAFRSVAGYQIHKEITEAAIGFDFVDKETLEKIKLENNKCDEGTKFEDPPLHFDNEAFNAGTERLAYNLNRGFGGHHTYFGFRIS